MNRGSDHVFRLKKTELDIASMRPRFMNRGSSETQPSLASAKCRFNEAPIHESGKWCPDEQCAIRAYRFNEAPIHESGKSRPLAHGRSQLLASMRPRFMNRGSRKIHKFHQMADLASMRPRFMNRGSQRLDDHPLTRLMELQ